jgi:hypothetical protein
MEFMNQAIELRVKNTEVDPVSGDVVPEKTPSEKALDNIVMQLTSMKESFMQGTGSNQVTILDTLEDIKDHQKNIEKALDGTNASGVARRIYNMITPLNNIKDAIDDGADDIVTAIGGVSVTVNVASQDIADGIDASKISDIASDIHDIYNGNTGNIAEIADAVSSIDQKTPTPTP